MRISGELDFNMIKIVTAEIEEEGCPFRIIQKTKQYGVR